MLFFIIIFFMSLKLAVFALQKLQKSYQANEKYGPARALLMYMHTAPGSIHSSLPYHFFSTFLTGSPDAHGYEETCFGFSLFCFPGKSQARRDCR